MHTYMEPPARPAKEQPAQPAKETTMLHWMRDPAIARKPEIVSGLVDLCEYLKEQGAARKGLEVSDTCVMYEIGSFAGESAEIFAHYFDQVHCVDPWDDPYKGDPHVPPNAPSVQAIERSFEERAILNGNMIKHKCRSLDIVTSVVDESLDFVYIDGDHHYTNVLADIRAWWPKVRSGAFLGGHDYYVPPNPDPPAQEVMRAFQDFFKVKMELRSLKLFADFSWVVRKA